MKQRATFQVIWMAIAACILAGCSTSVSYKPPLLPVRLVIDSAGNVSVVGEMSIVTFIGEFSIGAQYTLNSEPDSITVILRDENKGSYGLDTIYRVQTGGDEFTVVLNGETTVRVANRQVLIDVTEADVESIAFERAEGLGVSNSAGFWQTGEQAYRPFKVMQRMQEQGTWLSGMVALLFFPVELLAIPLRFVLRVGQLLAGDIGFDGALFVYLAVMIAAFATAGKSKGSLALAIITGTVFFCGGVISWLV